MKIGLVGEAPNDTTAIQNLLSRQYQDFDFVTLLDRIHGSMLDNKKAINRLLRVEYEDHLPDVIIFIRDLDALENDKKAKRKRQEIFSYSNRIVNKTGLFLLNIFEMEALILSDIDVFNHYYGCEISMVINPMTIRMPKEVLMDATYGLTNQFKESHNPALFNLLNFDTVKQNCRYFAAFIKKLDRTLAIKNL